MSIVSCFFIILLLCLSKKDYSCKARQIEAHYKVQLHMESAQGRDSFDYRDRGHIVTSDQEQSNKGLTRGKFSGGVLRKQPLVYVSWRVPSKKQDNKKNSYKDKNPGFYSDYSRPRTRILGHAGREMFESFCHVSLLKATQIKEPRRRGLSAKEAVQFNAANKVEDNHDRDHAVVSDYEPPHGTPPIHN
ncbi:hypothetical protein L484_003386 [Morus notabilis]|uniref:Uncharacterized protein n=1 Tax=Morus notabilis TaxID=981085 RepID=W9RTI1_9ROSA|nr:hypothetical protein L484_003386 [Morus notabilis]